jgi:hypothetical protein
VFTEEKRGREVQRDQMVGANCPHTFTTGEIRPSYGGVFTQGRLSERGASQGKRRDALEDIQ